jgi:hypothetical protein
MTIPRPLVAPALWGFGAGLLALSFPSALLALFALAVAGASMRLPRIAAFAAAAGATSAVRLASIWVECEMSSPGPVCGDPAVLGWLAALTAGIGAAAVVLMRGRYRV